MHDNRFFQYDRRSIDYASGLIDNARAVKRSKFAAAYEDVIFAGPHLHGVADLRGAFLPMSTSRAQLTSSDNPFQNAISAYI